MPDDILKSPGSSGVPSPNKFEVSKASESGVVSPESKQEHVEIKIIPSSNARKKIDRFNVVEAIRHGGMRCGQIDQIYRDFYKGCKKVSAVQTASKASVEKSSCQAQSHYPSTIMDCNAAIELYRNPNLSSTMKDRLMARERQCSAIS